MKKMLLIDGSNMMFRAYYATAHSGNLMRNSKGEPTNAVYAFTNMLLSILEEDFTHALVAFDKGKATFRHQLYEDYKAQRKPMPDDFKMQLSGIKEAPERLGFTVYETEALEADDIIGTLATRYAEQFDAIEIISSDRDLFQLLDDNITLRIAKRGLSVDETVSADTVRETYGLTPEQIPDLKGLMGDSSDNIPGVPGVGEKTAIKLLSEFGTIDELLQNTNELKGKQREKIERHGKDALRWRDLTRLKTDAQLPFSLDDLAFKPADHSQIVEFFETYEFHSLIKRFSSVEEDAREEDPVAIIADAAQIPRLLSTPTTIILEAFGSNYHDAIPLGFALANENGVHFVPFEVFEASSELQAFLADSSKTKYTHDYKRSRVLLESRGYAFKGVTFDFLLAAYVLNPSSTKEDFRVVASFFGDDSTPYLEEVYGKGAKQAIPEQKSVAEYAAAKARTVSALKAPLSEKLQSRNQADLFSKIELPLSSVLADMERLGVRIDIEALGRIEAQLDEEIATLTKKIHDEAGEAFNIGSPKQLSHILFEKLSLPVLGRTKTGPSTNIDVLKKLQGKHPIIEPIIRYRTVSKLKSAYVRTLRDAVREDGRIHTIYKQAFTQTGRLSSIEPNLQTIPIRTETGRQLRKVFVPGPKKVLVAADYSQIELRILAHMAKEQRLINVFREGGDVHAATGREILGKETLDPDERRLAKAVNFGILYGQTPYGLSEELGISRADAEAFIERYYERFPGIRAFMDSLIGKAEADGFVETLYHRRRYIPEIKSLSHPQRQLGKRTAMNAPIQGSAADLIKVAMLKVDERLREENLGARLILQIHDELVLEVPEDERPRVAEIVQHEMEHAAALSVPLDVDLAWGGDLDAAK